MGLLLQFVTMMKAFTLLSAIALLTGCSTGYHSQNFFGNGFSEVKTSPDSFIVSFKGNGYSKTDKMMKYALRRASELALENGYKYFKIVHTMETSNYTGSTSSISKDPSFSIRIKCLAEKSNDPDEVDAEFFLTNNL